MDIPAWAGAIERFNPEWLAGIGELLTGLAVAGFGFAGLRQYREGHKLDAAEMLMKTEQEFRRISGICNEIEVGNIYRQTIKPVLEKFNTAGCDVADLNSEELTLVKRLDRALRFFYVCTILHDELHVDEGVIGRAYYYWLGLLISAGREDLHTYIKKYYRRLATWLDDNKDALDLYATSGKINKNQ